MISIITWDASFREKFHTVDSFCQQQYPCERFEFIWVDFYNNANPVLLATIGKYSNARLLNLNNSNETMWHLGKCFNAGVANSKGDIVVLPDGDILVDEEHMNIIVSELNGYSDKVLFFRRWDEQEETHCSSSYSIEFLEKHTKLLNATNYAGCIAMHRSTWNKINGYEESDVFAGPGANGMETYLRLRNAGFAIKWHEKKIYHPWHSSTGTSDKMTQELAEISKYVKWLNPYSGISQSWALKNRELDLSFKANDGKVHEYLKTAPSIEVLRKQLPERISRKRQIYNALFR